jgi:hypothetical protein
LVFQKTLQNNRFFQNLFASLQVTVSHLRQRYLRKELGGVCPQLLRERWLSIHNVLLFIYNKKEKIEQLLRISELPTLEDFLRLGEVISPFIAGLYAFEENSTSTPSIFPLLLQIILYLRVIQNKYAVEHYNIASVAADLALGIEDCNVYILGYLLSTIGRHCFKIHLLGLPPALSDSKYVSMYPFLSLESTKRPYEFGKRKAIVKAPRISSKQHLNITEVKHSSGYLTCLKELTKILRKNEVNSDDFEKEIVHSQPGPQKEYSSNKLEKQPNDTPLRRKRRKREDSIDDDGEYLENTQPSTPIATSLSSSSSSTQSFPFLLSTLSPSYSSSSSSTSSFSPSLYSRTKYNEFVVDFENESDDSESVIIEDCDDDYRPVNMMMELPKQHTNKQQKKKLKFQ